MTSPLPNACESELLMQRLLRLPPVPCVLHSWPRERTSIVAITLGMLSKSSLSPASRQLPTIVAFTLNRLFRPGPSGLHINSPTNCELTDPSAFLAWHTSAEVAISKFFRNLPLTEHG